MKNTYFEYYEKEHGIIVPSFLRKQDMAKTMNNSIEIGKSLRFEFVALSV